MAPLAKKQKIGLVMIVKDGAGAIGPCLESVKPLVSSWTIVDTGSSDDTVGVILESIGDVPGELFTSDWRGFGFNRTEALRLARERTDAEYLLMLDADHRLVIDGELPWLTADSYMVRVLNPTLDWKLPLLTKADHPFEYAGAAHSFLRSKTGEGTFAAPLPQLAIEPGPSPTREKLERDVPLLEGEWAEQPHDPRTVFYLAQTYRDVDRTAEAEATWELRAKMSHGWDQETFWAHYQWGCAVAARDFDAAVPMLLAAWSTRPTRAEPLWVIANGYAERGNMNLARLFGGLGRALPQPEDTLFVIGWMYQQPTWDRIMGVEQAPAA